MTKRLVKNIMPKTETQFENIRRKKRKLILNIALKCFAESGYYNCPVSEIARTAGISKGLIYNYFNSKEDLLNALVKDVSYKVAELFDPNHDGVLTKYEFFGFQDKLAEHIPAHLSYWQFYLSILSRPDVAESVNIEDINSQNRFAEMLIDFFRNRGCSDPEGETLIFSMLIKGAVMTYLTSPKSYPLDFVINKIKQMYYEKFSNNNS